MGAIVPPYNTVSHEFTYVATGAEATVAGASDFTLTFPAGYAMPNSSFGAKVADAGLVNPMSLGVKLSDNTTTSIHVKCGSRLTAGDVLLVTIRALS